MGFSMVRSPKSVFESVANTYMNLGPGAGGKVRPCGPIIGYPYCAGPGINRLRGSFRRGRGSTEVAGCPAATAANPLQTLIDEEEWTGLAGVMEALC